MTNTANNYRTLTQDEFDVLIPLEKNHLLGLTDEQLESQSFNGCMFETHGKELEYVKSKIHENKVITILTDDDGEICFGSGFHYVNRIGYMIAKNPLEFDFDVLPDNDVDFESKYEELQQDLLEFNNMVSNKICSEIKRHGGFMPLKKAIQIEVRQSPPVVVYLYGVAFTDENKNYEIIGHTKCLSLPDHEHLDSKKEIIALNQLDSSILMGILHALPILPFGKDLTHYEVKVKGYYNDGFFSPLEENCIVSDRDEVDPKYFHDFMPDECIVDQFNDFTVLSFEII